MGEAWDQHARAWEWHKSVWEHHQHIHQQHLHHHFHHHHQHQSLLSDVMSCLGGGWGMSAPSWCHHPYPEAKPGCQDRKSDGRLQESPTPDCRWSGHFDDPPYQPAPGKPPPSPLPPSGTQKSRDTSSQPREGSRSQTRQRSRSRRRAHSANAKYRVELEIPPHLLSRPRPSSFTNLVTRRPGSHSPEPLEDDLGQETLLYLSGAATGNTAETNRRRYEHGSRHPGQDVQCARPTCRLFGFTLLINGDDACSSSMLPVCSTNTCMTSWFMLSRLCQGLVFEESIYTCIFSVARA